MTVEEASRYLGVPKSSLDFWRIKKTGPKFLRFERKSRDGKFATRILYLKDELDRWKRGQEES